MSNLISASAQVVLQRLNPMLELLSEAWEYAEVSSSDIWEFAVEIQDLLALGFSPNDLRVLVRLDLVKHATEVTMAGQNGRQFQSSGDLTFASRSCFVLTQEGRASRQIAGAEASERASTRSMGQSSTPVPNWNPNSRTLLFAGQIVKRFRWQAANQETILSAFQEENWPERIDDPLPPNPEQDSKRRLSDTIKCLNRKQISEVLHFRGDGTGEGAIWEPRFTS